MTSVFNLYTMHAIANWSLTASYTDNCLFTTA